MGARRQPLTGRLAAALLALAAAPATAVELPMTVARPDGPGPFPAVVILHDCSGLGPRSSGSPGRWSTLLTAAGYVTAMPDSFTPRGRPDGVCAFDRGPRIPPSLRAEDAHAAMAHLRTLPFVDPARIAVMGGSHGGTSTLHAASIAPGGAPGFAAAIALYPACRLAPEPFAPLSPLTILIGGADDWSPAAHCERLTAPAAAAGRPFDLVVYPGAHHAFDSRAPVRYVAERRNVNAPSGRGATTGGDPAAWADARARVLAFLGERLARR
ncbi:MAG: dienelactone hydrolase family protein [Alphaproteobacteria bacterium]